MAVSMKNVDPAFQGIGQKAGLEIWRIENFVPVPLPKSDHGKFYTGDSYIILKTTALKSGALRYDIHFWLGKATSQDEAGTAAIKSVELDAALGGRAVQYREVQGSESDKFLTYFKPCIIPLEGGCASGFKKPEVEKIEPRLFCCKGRRVVRVKEVPFSRSSLNHDDVFILDTDVKIYQFNGVNSSIQERAKALEVVQFIKDNDHDGKCAVAIVEDGKMAAEADAGEFWGLFGGFAPIGKKASIKENEDEDPGSGKLFICLVDGNVQEVSASPLPRELLETDKCYLLDGGPTVYVWTGRATSLDERKSASKAAEEYIAKKPETTRITRVIEGFETLPFKSYFGEWTTAGGAPVVSEEGRGKVAALLKQQGVDVKGLLKGASVKEDEPSLFNSSGKLEVWRVDGKTKTPVPSEAHGHFYSGDCFVVRYTYQGDQKETECFVCCWLGNQSTEEDQSSAFSHVEEISSSFKGRLVQARVFEGKEPSQFFALFSSLVIFKGGQSSGYKTLVSESASEDETYTEEGLALFRVRGTKPYNSLAVQVEPVSASLNSSDCFIFQSAKTYLLWFGSFSTLEEQQVAARIATSLKSESSPKSLKEGSEPPTFWNALGGKKVYPSQRELVDSDKDPRLFEYTRKPGNLLFEETFNFTQDDLLSDDIMILDTRCELSVWIGQNVSPKDKKQGLAIAEKYVERANRLDGLSKDIPIFKILEGSEPAFFTRHFAWDPSKSAAYVDPFERRLAALQGRPAQGHDTPPKKRTATNGANEPKLDADSSSPMASSQRQSPLTPRPSFTPRKSPVESKEPSPEPVVDPTPTTSESSDAPPPPAATGPFSYEILKVKSSSNPPGIDVTKRESYLSPEEFKSVFGMEVDQFRALPKWKQDQYKKAADLF
ncbi:hypothetical protein SELMODRAFT_177604 [Selaginella moellendorffii]|uniref:HP domain-containing protein n=1 Tax=Selaginella moellendorffii TaxID=88036 RepID=D8S7L1_SELML|nr:villin-3 [Selaginella moellendorffii]EFJ19773.1 hypothetical protein SELMODRAFT_177604 [Selaginella moellendorffii]|eukprot:XP_002979365.1 villin-3 [Selaginella moellendorffii]